MAESALTPLLGAASRLRPRPRGRDGADRQRAPRRLPRATSTRPGPSTGAAGHSARPWLADNAIQRAAAGIAALAAQRARRRTSFDGLTFTEVVSVTRIAGGIADNVIPDRVDVPTSTSATRPAGRPPEAEARLRELCAGHGELEVTSNAPSGAGRRTATRSWPRLRGAAGWRVEPKQAWTPVAEFGRGRPRRRELRPGRPRAGAPARRVVADRRAGRAPTACSEALARRMRLSPVLAGLRTYPFVAPAPRPSSGSPRRGVGLVDFGIGEPREETPAFIREALAASIEPLLDLPRGRRAAGAARRDRRLGASGASASRSTPTTEVVPDARLQGGDLPPRPGASDGDVVAVPTPGYPVPERGARVRRQGACSSCRCAPERGFLPDLDAVPPDLGARRRCCG